MHFLMPSVFSSHTDFKEWFSNPLTGMVEGSQEYSETIVRRLHKVGGRGGEGEGKGGGEGSGGREEEVGRGGEGEKGGRGDGREKSGEGRGRGSGEWEELTCWEKCEGKI